MNATPQRPPLDADALRGALLAPDGPYARIETVAETGSTNADLAAAAGSEPGAWPDLSVLASDFQSTGRGRLERGWSAPPRSSLAVSVLFRPSLGGAPLPAESYGWLSMLCALGLAEAIGDCTGLDARVKWPNDVLVGGRKVAGILAQLVPAGPLPAVVVGAGVNVLLTADELPVPTATSLALEGATAGTTAVLTAYLRTTARLYRGFLSDGADPAAGLRDAVAARMATLGAAVRAELPGGVVLEGTADSLEDDGGLGLALAGGGREVVRAGDVVHLRRADGRYA
ncbi:biotin--[acetyl-CoA-carboxylase] ligase [Zafaria sp. Z1313]|uniref:biotin--[acetyl-CoA-carboxylase] ligase n=1 Tax=unclassified Zafaria TaxID=2828765 RepID=UPI002E76ED6A|nr:biotin--[acetyl-CoA-carboxylase] ligase [Zafaria sp. J156]MEE1619995.1 biotin--[acetyl-CoA-carboxylase] ligase [Zafaria sp. J156]